MTSESIVRSAGPEDRAEIWRLLRLLHAENAMFSMSERKVNFYLDRLLHPENIDPSDSGPRGFIGVIGKPGQLEAGIMMTVGSIWYSEELNLDEHFNFVDPSHRASNHAKSLIKYAKHCVDEVGIRLVIGILSTKRTAAKVRLYEREMTAAGAFFIYPAPADIAPPTRLYRTH